MHFVRPWELFTFLPEMTLICGILLLSLAENNEVSCKVWMAGLKRQRSFFAIQVGFGHKYCIFSLGKNGQENLDFFFFFFFFAALGFELSRQALSHSTT
jgi:hypothetical protein